MKNEKKYRRCHSSLLSYSLLTPVWLSWKQNIKINNKNNVEQLHLDRHLKKERERKEVREKESEFNSVLFLCYLC